MNITLKTIWRTGIVATLFLPIYSNPIRAQSCTIAPTCENLGYTKSESECKNENILKCPFDQNKIFCSPSSHPSSKPCPSPAIGYLLYSDMTCSAEYDKTKTVIGRIFSSKYRLAMSLKNHKTQWSNEKFDISYLPKYFDSTEAVSDWNGKENTKIIIDYCKANGKSCPAAEYAYSYSTEGTKPGDWYLPALGELVLLTSYTINNGYNQNIEEKPWGVIFSSTGVSSYSDQIWAIELYDNPDDNSDETLIYNFWANTLGYVRPVLAF